MKFAMQLVGGWGGRHRIRREHSYLEKTFERGEGESPPTP